MDKIKEAQARIDAMFESSEDFKPVYARICEYAKRGVETPGSLSDQEIKEVCYALIVHFAQLGIG